MKCEDYACHVPKEKDRAYYIGVICDGHSDSNCFRSEMGAKFGCESASEVLSNFFESFQSMEDEDRAHYLDAMIASPPFFANRLKRAVLTKWNQLVKDDLKKNPVTAEVLVSANVKEGTREVYLKGKYLNNIYGSTLLAVGVCYDLFVAMQIGDGIIIVVNPDGSYAVPVPGDDKSETGSPASLCDMDLLRRQNAFRCTFEKVQPFAAFVTSDGVEDCLDTLGVRQCFKTLADELLKRKNGDNNNSDGNGLNTNQKQYLGEWLKKFATSPLGAQDDCSLAGFYQMDLDRLPEVSLPPEELEQMIRSTESGMQSVMKDYSDRKASMEQIVLQKREEIRKKESEIEKKWRILAALKNADKELEQMKNDLRSKMETLDKIEENKKEKVKEYERHLETLQRMRDALGMSQQSADQTLDPSECSADTTMQATTDGKADVIESVKLRESSSINGIESVAVSGYETSLNGISPTLDEVQDIPKSQSTSVDQAVVAKEIPPTQDIGNAQSSDNSNTDTSLSSALPDHISNPNGKQENGFETRENSGLQMASSINAKFDEMVNNLNRGSVPAQYPVFVQPAPPNSVSYPGNRQPKVIRAKPIHY